MKFELQLSLQEITAIKVATILWNCMDRRRIMACLEKYHNLPLSRISMQRKLLRIEDQVKIKISDFEVPESRKKEVANLIKPLGIEILKWCKFHCLDGYLDIDIPNEFYWTSRGTIDLKKTAEVLVRDESLCLTARYKLACIYCLEENITELWLKMSEGCRSNFYSSEEWAGLVMQHMLVTFWTLFKRGEITRMESCRIKSPYQFAFESAAVSGNIVATQFFWEKLTPREKESSLLNTVKDVARKSFNHRRDHSDFPAEYYPEVLFFLLSQLKAEQQIELFESHALAVLKCFMQWPFHSVLMETASIILSYTSDFDYCNFLKAITYRVHEGHRYYNYSGLFTEVWKKSPLTRKKYVASSPSVGHLITTLLRNKDIPNVKLVLDEIDPVVKKEYLLGGDGYSHWHVLMDRVGWDSIRMIIQQCVPLREDLEKFKEKVTVELSSHKSHTILVSLLNRLIRQQDKRKSEDHCGNSSKKHSVSETE